MKSVIITYGQTTLDVAIQEYGCAEGEVLIVQDNRIAFGADLIPGHTLLIREPVPELTANNKLIAANFKKKNKRINSMYLISPVENPFYSSGFYGSFYEI